MSIRRAILIGAALAVVAIAVVAVLLATGVLGPFRPSNAPVEGPVLVALVLPDEAGIVQPRLVDVYSRTSSGWTVASVSPTLPVVVSGTSGSTLADAYSFGGGAALAKAYESLGRGTAVSWVVVGPAAWSGLTGSAPLAVDLPAHLEVFDGQQLVAFEEGSATISPEQTALLFDGVRYLPAAQSAMVRAQLGDRLADAFSKPQNSVVAGFSSDLTPQRLGLWFKGLGAVSRVQGD